MTKGEQLSPEDAAVEKKLLEEMKSEPGRTPPTQMEDTENFLMNIDL